MEHPIPSSGWDSTNRFCFRDNYHPEYPTLLTADLQGLLHVTPRSKVMTF